MNRHDFALRVCRAALAAAVLVGTVGCRQRTSETISFEPEPRPVLAKAGFSPTLYARVAANSASSSALRMLATIGEPGHSRLALLSSIDGGDSFAGPVWVNGESKPIRGSGEGGPAFVATPDQMYAAWTEEGELLFARAINRGASFAEPIKLADSKGHFFSGYPTLAVAPNEDVYAVWLDTREQTSASDDNYSVFLARSTDHGASFGANVRIASKTCECCRPTLAFGSRGEVMVIWRHLYQNPSQVPATIRDMTVVVSTDNGNTFSAPQRIAADNWKLTGCPDSGAATARVGNRVYVAWLTEASPEVAGVRLSWSDDGGETWAPSVKGSQEVLDANYPSLTAMDDGTAVLVFQGRDPKQRAGWSEVGVFAVRIAADGRLSPPISVPGISSTASRPTIAAGSNGRVFVSWTGAQDGKPAVFLARGRFAEGSSRSLIAGLLGSR